MPYDSTIQIRWDSDFAERFEELAKLDGRKAATLGRKVLEDYVLANEHVLAIARRAREQSTSRVKISGVRRRTKREPKPRDTSPAPEYPIDSTLS